MNISEMAALNEPAGHIFLNSGSEFVKIIKELVI